MRRAVWRAAALGLLAALASLGARAEDPRRLSPDDAGGPAFAAYYAALLEAVRARDARAVVDAASADVKLSFGGAEGRDALLARLAGPGSEAAWAALADALDHGVAASGRQVIVAPYWFPLEPPARFDPFLTYFAPGSDVPVRAGPHAEAPEIDAVSYAFVAAPSFEAAAASRDRDYWPVELPSGARGHIHRDYLRAVVDWRVGFREIDGRWRMVFFIAGD